jgi:hypothetical protein
MTINITIPTSAGELIDKITILEIKAARIGDPARLAHVHAELAALTASAAAAGIDAAAGAQIAALTAALKAVYQELWDIEDDIRGCERAQEFGARFIALARAVYRTNDRRAALKTDINRLLSSALVEVKSYADY